MNEQLRGEEPIEEAGEEAVDTPEKESPIKVTFVYRGTNPYMRALAKGMREAGANVSVTEVPVDTDEKILKDPDKLGGIVGDIEGHVVTDDTLSTTVNEILDQHTLNAYKLRHKSEVRTVEDVQDKLGPIIEEIRDQERVPVVLGFKINNHNANNEFPPSSAGTRGDYGKVISAEFNVPLLLQEFMWRGGKPTANLIDVLKEHDIDPEKAVLLADHHIYEINDDGIKESGLDQLQIIPVCPCCLGKGGEFVQNLEDKGFNVFPIEHGSDTNTTEAVESLSEKLKDDNSQQDAE